MKHKGTTRYHRRLGFVVDEVVDLALLKLNAEARGDVLGQLAVGIAAENLDVVLEHGASLYVGKSVSFNSMKPDD